MLAARCGVQAKYELIIYPIQRQEQPEYIAMDDRDAFIKRIQEEIVGRQGRSAAPGCQLNGASLI